MKKISILLFLPLFTLAQDFENNQTKHNKISFSSSFITESDDLSTDFLNTMLFGGFITHQMKEDWINSGDDINRLNIEARNSFHYSFLTKKMSSFYLTFSDINTINTSFKDDLLRLAFHGNFDYQGQTLDFSNTILRADRYQQYKFGYNFIKDLKNKNSFEINTALSYLSGNYHAQFHTNKGNLYTAPLGTSLDVNYDINALVTDTTDLSLFAGNGSGLATDFSFTYNKDESEIYSICVKDFGFINWNKNSIVASTDSTFSFSGIEIDDFDNIFDFNDSILDISTDFVDDQNKKFRSYIPAKISFNYTKKLDYVIFKDLRTVITSRWQAYEIDKGGLILRGFEESAYKTSVDLATMMDLKYLYSYVGFCAGGYTDGTKIHLAITNKGKNLMIGTYNFDSLFKQDETKLSGYLQLSTRF